MSGRGLELVIFLYYGSKFKIKKKKKFFGRGGGGGCGWAGGGWAGVSEFFTMNPN